MKMPQFFLGPFSRAASGLCLTLLMASSAAFAQLPPPSATFRQLPQQSVNEIQGKTNRAIARIRNDPQMKVAFERAMEGRDAGAATRLLVSNGFLDAGQYSIALPGPHEERLGSVSAPISPLWHCGFYKVVVIIAGGTRTEYGIHCAWD